MKTQDLERQSSACTFPLSNWLLSWAEIGTGTTQTQFLSETTLGQNEVENEKRAALSLFQSPLSMEGSNRSCYLFLHTISIISQYAICFPFSVSFHIIYPTWNDLSAISSPNWSLLVLFLKTRSSLTSSVEIPLIAYQYRVSCIKSALSLRYTAILQTWSNKD